MTIKERLTLQAKLTQIHRFIQDFKDQGVNPDWVTIERWMSELSNLIKYKK